MWSVRQRYVFPGTPTPYAQSSIQSRVIEMPEPVQYSIEIPLLRPGLPHAFLRLRPELPTAPRE